MIENRLSLLRNRMTERGLDAFLVTDIANIFYLSGFTGSTAALIVSPNDSFLLVDSRYTTQAKGQCPIARVQEYAGKSTIVAAAQLINDISPKTIAYEPDNLSVSTFRALRKTLDRSISLRSTRGIIEQLRSIKDMHEIELMRKAIAISDETYSVVTSKVHAGMSEKDVALLIDYTNRKLGADKDAFDTIAASGPNSACPHASPTDRILQVGDLLKMDYGARREKYNSDITRTVCIGEPTDKQKEIYSIVLDAQIKAIETIAPGKTGKEIDAIARDYIASRGYGDNFGHGLGHALGIHVHDGPGFSRLSNIVLKPGMVITVEPGIYIEGWGGVRIEDDILVTETGYEDLTNATKELISIRQ